MPSNLDLERIMALSREYAHLGSDRIALSRHIGSSVDERRAVAAQVAMQATLGRKLPAWAVAQVYIPSSLNLEQASSEETALHKASLLRPEDRLIDLTGGMGVDFWAMAQVLDTAVYVEQSPELYTATRYNMPRLLSRGTQHYIQGDSMALLPELINAYRPTVLFVDPARRVDQQADKRVYAIEDCSPSLHELLELVQHLGADAPSRILAKLSPMLDVKHCLEHLPHISAVWAVAYRGEVKELLLDIRPLEPSPSVEQVPLRSLDLLTEGRRHNYEGTFAQEQTPCPIAEELGAYIYEPNGAILKLGMYQQLGRSYGLVKLHQHTHIYTSRELIEDFPGRILRVERIWPYQSKLIKRLSRELPAAQITCRNFPLGADKLRQQLKLRDSSRATIVATTLHDGSLVLIETTRV